MNSAMKGGELLMSEELGVRGWGVSEAGGMLRAVLGEESRAGREERR